MSKAKVSKIIPVTVNAKQRLKLLNRAAAYYRDALAQQSHALDYLAHTLHIRHAPFFRDFQIGVSVGRLLESLPIDETLRAQLIEIGLLTPEGNETLKDCIVVPLYGADDSLVNLVGKRLSDGADLFLNNQKSGLWNAPAARRSADLVLTDGVFDAMLVMDRGVSEVMPCFGQLSDELLQLLLQHRVKRVVLAFHDEHDVCQQLIDNGIACVVMPLAINGLLAIRDTLAMEIANAFAALIPSDEKAHLPLLGEYYQPTPNGFTLSMHTRYYDVLGIERNKKSIQINITLKAYQSNHPDYELDTFAINSGRRRHDMIKKCAALFAVGEGVIKTDMNRIIEYVYAWKPHTHADIVEVPLVSPEAIEAATAFLKNPNLLDLITSDLTELGICGEANNKKLVYVVSVSRKLSDPLSLVTQSRSGSGKSALQEAVLKLVPEEDKVSYTALTQQALFYQHETQLANKVLALEEDVGLGKAAYSLRALISSKLLKISTTVKDPTTGKTGTREHIVKGAISVMTTTTSATIDEETESRFLICKIDESETATASILAKQRHKKTLDGYLESLTQTSIIEKHHVAQRMLEPLVVINPYADQLQFPTHSLKSRRNQQKYLTLIEAITFLFQKQRRVQTILHQDQKVRYIEVTKEDIRWANTLAVDVFANTMDELSTPARQLLTLIHAHVKTHCETHQLKPCEYIFTRKDIRQLTGWSETQTRNAMNELTKFEYLRSRTGTWTKEYHCELSELGDIGKSLCLIDPDQLVEA